MRRTARHYTTFCFLLAAMLLGVALRMDAQVNNTRLKSVLNDYFKLYTNTAFENNQKYSLLKVMTSESARTVEVYANEVFGMQPFTPTLVDEILNKIKLLLPTPYNTYSLTVYAANKDIRELVTSAWSDIMGERRHWGAVEYKGIPWVQNMSLPTTAKAGLQGRHLSLWASHGKVYSNGEHKWVWQRPHLFCTTEDLLTQSITTPFLYPMLERAGAIVFTPRERDWQRLEIVVDNDQPTENGIYLENMGYFEWETIRPGFSNAHKFLTDFDDPHHEGTARIVAAQNNKRQASNVTWSPLIQEDGEYAVYVTYPVLPNAVPDASYHIVHSGIHTEVRVNQQMGGSTWVYLGTFDFKAQDPKHNYIKLTNVSNYRGYIGADAIRLGGGMSHIKRADLKREIIEHKIDTADSTNFVFIPGSIVKPNGQIVDPGSGLIEHIDSLFGRSDSTVQLLQYTYTNDLISSNLPRHLEAARYTTQWMGLKREQFGVKDGTYDYGDDINARPIATNYLARGSVYLPGDSGLCVPLELNLALHSDAGYKRTMDHIGSLAIYTTDVDDGMLPGGQNRLASRDLCDILLQQVTEDISRQYGRWTRRQLYDRNYGETRIPRIPAAILEMFSHQNYADMTRALDPAFKFSLARSIYKGILRFVHLQHNKSSLSVNPIIAPLPIHAFAAQADPINHHIRLTWKATTDTLENTAQPTCYIVYTRKADMGWDNGTVVNETIYDFEAPDSLLYHFRIEAVNDGGRSMPSETLCARLTNTPDVHPLLIVNGFQRVASPEAICSKDSCGFDMNKDPGVPYVHTTEFCGNQLYFDWDGIGKETSKGMGYSGTELEGMLVKGNTFDYPSIHAEDLLLAGDYNISSCSRDALENGDILPGAYSMIDLILGAQRADGYSSHVYKTFTPMLQSVLSDFTEKGGALLVSGAYVGSDMASEEEKSFTNKVLHYQFAGTTSAPETNILCIEGMGTEANYMMKPNEKHLSTAFVSNLLPDNRAFATLVYRHNRECAGVAYTGADYHSLTLGFPIEQITNKEVRQQLMHAFLDFLLHK